MAHYLLVIGDREALGWVLTAQRMAFPAMNRSETRSLVPGDTLLLYTTRGCFKNPTRDRGRVISAGTARTAVSPLEEPISIAGREFSAGCEVTFDLATPWPTGVALSPLIAELDTFADAGANWSIRLRRPLVHLTDRDGGTIQNRLAALEPQPLDKVLDDYARWWRASRRP
ncbi:hypothetical protein BJF85_02150 [Saccharomonospora sp. CUA-673]|uniref:hypothetical protein n=1 Tax=Saccharomonospora sp. CUA-673 TaxID=1904969 RepID=UPI0009605223|nr:hypothetical protein [Saccharomonospora sp. CUA-673]OLT45210.1 hypothetical protein BJF85_02150 [Saccharomonospora sp. CUA-673]